MKRNLIFILPLILLSSCYYDNEEELYDGVPCITGEVSYSTDILPILTANCYECHSIEEGPVSGDGLVLEGYTNLSVFLADESETFISAIEHDGGAEPMPNDGVKLDRCSIQAFKDWIEQGTNNN